ALFRRVPGPTGLHLSLLYAAHARHWHRVLHVRGHGAVAIGRVRGPHHRRAVLPGIHRYRARDRTGRGKITRSDDRGAHAATSGSPRTAGELVAAYRGDARGRAYLD